MNQKLYKRLEIAGGPVVFAIASFLHFLYDLTGKSVAGALFGAVNESVWEHLKIFSIAYIIWAIAELLWAKPPLKKFAWAKALGLYEMCISIAVFFYVYNFFTGKPILFLDLASGIVFAIFAHFISYKLTLSDSNTGQFFYTGVMLIFLALIMILCFTYFPPQSELFRDPVTGLYGVIPESFDEGAAILDTIYALN